MKDRETGPEGEAQQTIASRRKTKRKQVTGSERRAAWCGLLAGLLMIIGGITGIIWGMAGDGELLAAEMLRNAPSEKTGLPETEYSGVGRMIAGFLTGREAVFQYVWTDQSGEARPAFHAREAAHMEDCRKLIALDRTVCLAALGAAILLTAIGLAGGSPGPKRCAFGRGMLRSLRILGVLALLIGGWALADFDGFFRTFHRIAFTNDLWLMNPRTDLLIRLMPLSFFTGLGLRGVGLFVPIVLMTEIAARLLCRAGRAGAQPD